MGLSVAPHPVQASWTIVRMVLPFMVGLIGRG